MKLSGKFIAIDGPDGSGKGTQLDRLEAYLRAAGAGVTRTRDPGGTVIGDRIRHVLLGYDLTAMDPRCETLLFMASRAQLAAEVIAPALAAGRTVLCDRYISATCAYQVAAGFPLEEVLRVGSWAVGDVWPDLTIVLDVPVEEAFRRTGRQRHQVGRRAARNSDHADGQMAMFEGATQDAMERRPLEFHRRVHANFLSLKELYPRPVVVIDGTQPPDAIHRAILDELEARFAT